MHDIDCGRATCSGAEPSREVLSAARALGLEGRFGAWRGLSGRRYVVSSVAVERLGEIGPAVFVASARDEAGRLRLSAVTAGDPAAVVRDSRFRTADAVDVHLLAEDDAARDRVVADLGGSAKPARSERAAGKGP